MTTRVLLVCGSLQAMSSNSALLDVVRGHLLAVGAETEYSVNVGLVPAFNPDAQDQPNRVVEQLRTQIGRSSAVVISTPEYAAAIPGALKNALDWIVGSGELYGKPIALLSAGTTGGEYARRQLIRSLTWQGGHVIAHLGVAGPRTKPDADGRINDAETISLIRGLADQVLNVHRMTAIQRLELVERVTGEADIEPGHIAPVSET